MQKAIDNYLHAVEREFKTGIAVEHAYRPALKSLLEAIEINLNAVNDPKRSEIGAPDFQVLRGQTTIGFVEAKDIGISLDKTEKDEQMRRYLTGFANLILTDYLEFRWYIRGERQQTVRIASVSKKNIVPTDNAFDDLAAMLRGFVQVIVPTVNTAEELAKRMAANAHLIRDLIYNDLNSAAPSASLASQREAFRKTLLPDITDAPRELRAGVLSKRVLAQHSLEVFGRAVPDVVQLLLSPSHFGLLSPLGIRLVVDDVDTCAFR